MVIILKMYIENPLIKPKSIEKRAYQVNISKAAAEQSTLVVLPTGLGKTIIALLVIVDVLQKKKGRILFLAPTKPLVEQHAAFIKEFFVGVKPTVFTGEISPSKRDVMWEESKIIVSTPQVVVNDLISGRTKLNGFGLIIFDETHRAVGEYAYVFIAEKFKEKDGLVLGITASPGSDAKRILEICYNLGITLVEIRSEFDPDVVPYVHEIKVKWIEVTMPLKFADVRKLLKNLLDYYIKDLHRHGFLRGKKPVSTKDLLNVQRVIQAKLQAGGSPSLYSAASAQAAAMKVNHALELLETQGVSALENYLDRLKKEGMSRGASRAAKAVINHDNFKAMIRKLKKIEVEHPKVRMAIDVVLDQLNRKRSSRIIVFTHYRDTSVLISNELAKFKEVRPVRFVGQASRGEDKGLSQKKQVELIQKFKGGEYNVLVATSVAEEGLDIPATDLVLFYEPVPSEIRTIQRRGRTGRKRPGRVIVLITKSTRDEAYYWSSIGKEKRMKRELHVLRTELNRDIRVGEPRPLSEEKEFKHMKIGEPEVKPELKEDIKEQTVSIKSPKREMKSKTEIKPIKGQLNLMDFESGTTKLKIVADTREFNSDVVKELSRMEILVNPQQLDIGDYIISDRLAVERKEVDDFLQSLIDGRLFGQLKRLKSAYIHPVMILEGEGLFTRRQIKHTSIFGALASIVSDFGIPVISTKDRRETAELLAAMIRREVSNGRPIGLRGDKTSMSTLERQQFIIEGLPGVSATLAQRLLTHFGNVKAIMDADVEELCEVKGIGDSIAKGIVDVVSTGYLIKE